MREYSQFFQLAVFDARRVLTHNQRVKTNDIIVLAVLLPLFAACFTSFAIAFYYNARFFAHFLRRLSSGEIGRKQAEWKTHLQNDAYALEMQRRFLRFFAITFALFLALALAMGVLVATGTLKMTSGGKRATPTVAPMVTATPRVLAEPYEN